jgi:hypothetical protein
MREAINGTRGQPEYYFQLTVAQPSPGTENWSHVLPAATID